MRRPLVAGLTSPGTAAAAAASPGSKASRRRHPRPRISRPETSATAVRIPDPIRVVTAPNSGAPRASLTRPGSRPGRRRETSMRVHGQLADNPQLGQRRRRPGPPADRRCRTPPTRPRRRREPRDRPWPTLLPRSSGTRSHMRSPSHLTVSRPLSSQPNHSEDRGAGMRSQTAMRSDSRGSRDNDRPPTRISAGQPRYRGPGWT
jgi:hypothetical protein